MIVEFFVSKFSNTMIVSVLLLLICLFSTTKCMDERKSHIHQGMLTPYDGSLIEMMEFSPEQLKVLAKGDPVVTKERTGKSGRGIVVQDLNASTAICIQKIRDLPKYPKMVPHLKVCDVYDSHVFSNGTTKTKAKFVLGLFGVSIGYYLHLTYEPSYNTLTWTLDYSRLSDADDSIGHWQVMEHPTKPGWTRILYSTQVRLMPWVPEFIISFITSRALTEATGWLKREAEAEQKKQSIEAQKKQATATETESVGDSSMSNNSSSIVSKNNDTILNASGGVDDVTPSVKVSISPVAGLSSSSQGNSVNKGEGGYVIRVHLRAIAGSVSKRLHYILTNISKGLKNTMNSVHSFWLSLFD